jgi:hypothetical protein
MLQSSLETFFVCRRVLRHLATHARLENDSRSTKEDVNAEAKDIKDVDAIFALDSGPSEQHEPCAEPDVEPAPKAEAESFKAAHRSLRWQPAVAVVMAMLVFSFVPLAVVLDSITSQPLHAAEDAAPHSSGNISTNEEFVLARGDMTTETADKQAETKDPPSDDEAGEAANGTSMHTVMLTRHQFPVSQVGNIVYYRSAYFGTVHVGAPAVPFKVVFDTGSGHLILPSTYCQSETCRAHRRYRRGDSSTARDIDYDGTVVQPGQPRDQITVSFGTGEVTGVFVEDIVCMHEQAVVSEFDNSSSSIASAAAMQPVPASASISRDALGDSLESGCVKLRLIAATAMSEEPFKSFQFDGVLGLGLDGLSQAPEFNFIDVIMSSFGAAGNTPHTFAVFLAEDADEESKITFGGWDDNHIMEDLSWNSVVDPDQGHWTIRIKALRVDNEVLEFCHSGCKGVVDTGTSLLAVPSQSFSEIYTLLRHPAHMEGHCHGPGPQLHIELEHFTVTLGPEDYSRLERTPARKTRPRFQAKPHNVSAQGRTDLHCKPMLMSMDLPAPLGPKLFILGEPILRKYYSVYDAKEKRVGFARARHHTKPSSPLRTDMTPALKMEDSVVEKPASKSQSMFDVFRWRKLHRYGSQ